MEKILLLTIITMLFITSCTKDDPVPAEGGIIGHNAIDLSSIPGEWIEKAKETLHIAYGHTSHGSQITSGMTGLVTFKGDSYSWNNGGTDGALDLHDYAMSGDLGNPDFTNWEQETRIYLAANPDVNVIIWTAKK